MFCRETVDADLVTRTLALQPTLSYKAGDLIAVGNIKRVSSVGMWNLRLPGYQAVESVEEQLVRRVTLLQTKRERFAHLRRLGYSPYLDCRAEKGSLSLCVEPDVLAGLGTLGISLSVWLYEAPAQDCKLT
ncbi:DUF4279 domain-containing protein [Comamonas sp. B-9]|uniref:DUF4279 domain-containing protein n=1 Tax=Comamonas sp. B-9 TaxID=1055192 RepID=UPI0009FBAC95